MRPVWTDRVAVLGVLAGVLVWLGCLATLWGLTLDTVQSERLAMVVILLIECWVLCSRRWKLLSMAEVVIARCGWMKRVPLSDALRHRLGTTREDGRKRMRLLATASVGAVIGGILSTLWIPLAGVICNWLGSVFLFGETTWWLIERVLLAVGMLPMAAGLVGLLYTTYVVRVTGGRDTYASVLRDWLMSLTIASFALAAIRFFGCDLLVVVWTVAGAMLLVSLVSVSRAEVATHPRKTMLPFGQVDRSARRMVEYGFGGLTLVLLVQLRLLSDVVGLNPARQMAWVGLSIALLGFFLSRLDRRSHAPSRRQIIGCGMGVIVGLLCQVGELSHAVTLGGSGRMTMILLAIAAQIPIASLGATYINHTRRNYALAGGGVGNYVQCMLRGMVLGGFLLSGILLWGGGAVWLLATLALLLRLGLGARALAIAAHRPAWVLWPVVTAACLGGFVYEATSRFPGDCQIGSGVTLLTQGKKFKLRCGYLPHRADRRSEYITRGVAELFRAFRGRWWMVVSNHEDLPARPEENSDPSIYSRIFATGASVEPLVGSADRWPPVSYSHPNYFRFARHNYLAGLGCEYYDGLFLAPVPADHPAAWDCYNETLLRRVRAMSLTLCPDPVTGELKEASGIFALRTQTSPTKIRYLLHVARTFQQVLRKRSSKTSAGWALLTVRKDAGVDALFLGPHSVLVDPKHGALLHTLAAIADEDVRVYLLPLEKLWPGFVDDITPILLLRPPAESTASVPSLTGFRDHLDGLDIKLPLRD